ncbi:hypothetical protein LPJ56_006261 [Coemansia sp. RSA 2599]|nr:hypothetical protein LPJ56_006261 [Coemansia sp. RSA 2599]
MRRAATILAPGHQDSRHGVFEKLLLPPASCIYGEPASWASVYGLLMPHMRRTCAAADGNGLFDPGVDLLPESLVDAGALESAQLEERAEHGMPSSSNRNNRSSSSSSRPRNRQRRKGPSSGPSPAIAAAPIPDAEARADRRS